jgi:hypothetical protein
MAKSQRAVNEKLALAPIVLDALPGTEGFNFFMKGVGFGRLWLQEATDVTSKKAVITFVSTGDKIFETPTVNNPSLNDPTPFTPDNVVSRRKSARVAINITVYSHQIRSLYNPNLQR